MFCGHCGSKINETDIFCTECGQKQLQPEMIQEVYNHSAPDGFAAVPNGELPSQEPTEGGNNKIAIGIFATIFAGLAILIGMGLFLIFGGSDVEVPDFRNLTLDEAIQLIEESRLTVGEITEEYSRRVEEGLVISHSPRAGREVERGTPIDLAISLGERPALVFDFSDFTELEESITVPDFIGLTVDEATALLAASNLRFGIISNDYHADLEEGLVISQSLRVGSSAEPGDSVDLVVSLGARPPSVSPFDLDVWGEDQIITLQQGNVSVDVPIPTWLNDVVEDYRDRTEPVTDRRRGFRSSGWIMYVIDKERDDLKTMIQVYLLDYGENFLEAAEMDLYFLKSDLVSHHDDISSATSTVFYQNEGEFTAGIIFLEYPEDGSDQLIEVFELVKYNKYNGIMITTRLRFRAVNAPEGMCAEEFADAFGLWRYIDAGYMESDE